MNPLEQALRLYMAAGIGNSTDFAKQRDAHAAATQALAAISAQEVPAGEWVMVPREPTPEMVQAGINQMPHFTDEPGPVWAAMLTAAPAAPKQEWQPISSAPKDGRRLLVAIEGVDRAVVAIWNSETLGGGVWETIDGHNWAGRAVTHWMPLPAAPAAPRG